MAVELNLFFKAIAERYHNENDLSDITYALCQSDKAFLQFFLDFFFGEGKINVHQDKIEIEREYAVAEGRPDFAILVNGKCTHLIEVKKGDAYHHFSQYQGILEKEGNKELTGHLGYITNYPIILATLRQDDQDAYKEACDNGRTVKTWKELSCKLESYLAFNDPMLKEYLNYLQIVCQIDNFSLPDSTPIKSSDFAEISRFIGGLEGKINEMGNEGVFYYNNAKKFGSGHMGHFFELRGYDGEQSAWGWVGVNYTPTGAVFFVEFENSTGWGKPVCEHFKSLSLTDNFLRFYLKNSNMKWEDFLEEIISYVKAKGGKPMPDFACLSVDEAVRFIPLLAMKSLPWLLDRYYLSLANPKLPTSWEIVSPERPGKDAEVQNSHCGRYYALQKNGQTILGFWLGMFYNATFKFAEHPIFAFDIATRDYEWIQPNLSQVFKWHDIAAWNRHICEIPLKDQGESFRDVVDSVVEVILEIIRGEEQKANGNP